MRVIARLLGIPGEDYLTFKHWSEAVMAFTSMPPEERAKNGGELLRYFGRMALARREQAADDLITALVEAEVEGDSLEDPELLGFRLILLIAGNNTGYTSPCSERPACSYAESVGFRRAIMELGRTIRHNGS